MAEPAIGTPEWLALATQRANSRLGNGGGEPAIGTPEWLALATQRANSRLGGMPQSSPAAAAPGTAAPGAARPNPSGVNWDAFRAYAKQAARGINTMPFVFSDQQMSPRGSLWAGADAAGTGPNPNALWNGPETVGNVPDPASIRQFIYPGLTPPAPAPTAAPNDTSLLQALLGILGPDMVPLGQLPIGQDQTPTEQDPAQMSALLGLTRGGSR